MSVINTNVKALTAQKAIQENSRTLTTAMERLSTGKRINSAKDDAAGLAISTRMEAQTRGLNMAIRNANDGISLMQTGEGAMNEVTDILQRMRELAVQSVNGTNNDSDRVALNDEVVQLKAEIDRIATTTEFNSQKLLDGSFKGKLLQIGDKADQTLKIDIGSLKLKDLGMGSPAGAADAIVGGRMVAIGFTVGKGDVLINDQEIDAIAATDDLEDIITNINTNVDNVTASGFNVVVAKNIGTGVTTDGQFDISVRALGASVATTYSISASENMTELVANINAEAGAVVQASVNDEGKLVLSNSTGASITVTDGSATALTYDGGSGFLATATTFTGFLKLESDDGNPVRIQKGTEGTLTDLANLGFRPTTSDVGSANDAYTVTGDSLTSAGVTTAWGASDLKINGVAIYSSEIATNTFEGKLDAINNFSKDTGVIASAYMDVDIAITSAQLSAQAGETFSLNGVLIDTFAAADTVAGFVTAINAKTAQTGLTAEETDTGIRLTGANVLAVTSSGTAGTTGGFTTATPKYASIRLDSVSNSPISIELGDTHTVAEHGFLEANVGAADHQVNGSTMGTGAGSNLSGLNIATASSATAALDTIDKAMGTVSDMRSKLGAMQNRLNSTVDNLSNVVTNTEAARSRIQDTDYATETTALAKSQIIQQAATAMLAQANQQPQSVLSLLQ
jgi:flagellin